MSLICWPAVISARWRWRETIRSPSIAFPAISCGIYGYPIDGAATIAVREVSAFLDTHDLPERVVLVAFDQETYETLATKLTKRIEAHEDS
jgi:O-acetyl-ADP-ribose deacetylase (regulator of RNase III)